MDRSKYIIRILCLKECMRQIFGDHFPLDIIRHIILIFYNPIKINCGDSVICVISNKSINISGDTDLKKLLDEKFTSGMNLKSIKCGTGQALILTSNGDVYHWRGNLRKYTLSNVKKIICKYGYGIALTQNNEMHVLFHPYNHKVLSSKINIQVTSVICNGLIDSIRKISCGKEHMMILTKLGQLYGYGISTHILFNTDNSFFQGVRLVECGAEHTIVITLDDQIYTWGNNSGGSRVVPPGNNLEDFPPGNPTGTWRQDA